MAIVIRVGLEDVAVTINSGEEGLFQIWAADNPNTIFNVKDISTFPDTLQFQITSGANGYAQKYLTFLNTGISNKVMEIQAIQDYNPLNSSNVVTVTIIPASSSCGSLVISSWKPAKTIAGVNESISFIVRSQTPNQEFSLQEVITGTAVLFRGTTDNAGCATGTLTPLAEGLHTIAMCYPGLLGTCVKFGETNITWGTVKTDWIKLGTYAIVILAGAYLIGQYINKGKSSGVTIVSPQRLK